MPQHDESPAEPTAGLDSTATQAALPTTGGTAPGIESAGHDAQTATLAPDDTQRAEAVDTQRAAAGDEALTELIADRPLPDTVSATAWSQTDDHPDDDGGDEDAQHERSRWPWRWVIGLAAGVFAILAIIATSVGFGGWGLEQRHQVEPSPTASAASPAPKTESAPPVNPNMPPEYAKLDGQYMMKVEMSKVTYLNSSPSLWGGSDIPDSAGYITYVMACNPDGCISTPLESRNAVITAEQGGVNFAMQWKNDKWVTISPRVGPSGLPDSTSTAAETIIPDGDGSFHGAMVTTIITGTYAGAETSQPFTLTPFKNPTP